MNEIESYSNLENILKRSRCNILLGNGFNMTLGVNTSYESLFTSLMECDHIKKIMARYPELERKIRNSNFNLESHHQKLTSSEHLSTVMSEFYEIILNRCKTRYKHKEVVLFLLNFNNFFTTNYDPLLYRFLLSAKELGDIDQNDSFFVDLKEIHDGTIVGMGSFENIPLSSITKKQVYDLANQIFKKEKKYKEKKRENYYKILREIREEPELCVNDGFIINQPKREVTENKYKIWDNKGQPEQNIFYLHGALHLHRENDQTRKLIMGKNYRSRRFINNILQKSSYSFCVFEDSSEKKLKKINRNNYLKHCLQSLSQSNEILVVIGWSCSENDQHLIDTINESSISGIYISIYSDSNLEKTKERFVECFPKKSVYFFRHDILPFSKKIKRKTE